MYLEQITIRRFGCIENTSWKPRKGLNCLIGPGDSGKSTILAAIRLLLSPSPNNYASEYDYYLRRIEKEFEIEAIIGGLSDDFLAALRIPTLWGWKEGALTPLPDEDGADAVLRVQVRGTSDLELIYEIVTQSGDPVPFGVRLRQLCNLVVMGMDEDDSRELRMGNGSILDRCFDDLDLRLQMQKVVQEASSHLSLPTAATSALGEIEAVFSRAELPRNLSLGIVPNSRGYFLPSMIALTTGSNKLEAIPLTFAGRGTKRMAVMHLAGNLVKGVPILVGDEPERGLEPYRQRVTMKYTRRSLRGGGQAFLVTHSNSILSELHSGALWRVVSGSLPVEIKGKLVGRLLREQPEFFLARTPIICEGPTEVGFLKVMLKYLHQCDIDAAGLFLADGNGNDNACRTGEEMAACSLKCGVFIDNEATGSGLRTRLAQNPKIALGVWHDVCNVEEAVAKWLELKKLDRLVWAAARLCHQNDTRHKLAELRGFLPDKHQSPWEALLDRFGEAAVRTALAKAMNEGEWFKSVRGGTILGLLVIRVGIPEPIKETIAAFWTRLRAIQ